MSWPTPQEYNEAIQNPRTAFSDPELKAGQPVLTPLGLPRPITGGFASVYQIACSQQRTFAVRCFLREFRDYQERYAAISAHLAANRLPYMVNFAFLTEGIRVAGRWYPILKMEWIDGVSLHTYIERNLQNPQKLLNLAEQWVQMIQALHDARIAHGDLQHGNVLVVNDQLRLIDYDGMYVPGLSGRQSHEIGHRNYQHPARGESYFAPGMDFFSAWIVYASLAALAADPKLWADFQGGDECLILRREDFDKPQASPVLLRMAQGTDGRVAALAGVIDAMLALPPEQAPPMSRMAALPVGANKEWLRDYINVAPVNGRRGATILTGAGWRQPPPGGKRADPIAPLPAPPAWLADHMPGSTLAAASAEFAGDVRQPRLVASGSAIIILATWFVALSGGLGAAAPAAVTVLAVLAALGVLLGSYSRDPSVEQMWRAQEGVRRMRRDLRAARKRMRRIEQDGARIDATRRARQERIDRKAGNLRLDEQRELRRLNAQLQARLGQLVQRDQQLRQRENAEVAAAEQRYASQIAARDTQLRRLGQAETVELAEALTRRQRQFVGSFLERQLIADATIPGIGPAIKERLQAQGIRRAADIELRRLAGIQGIGEGRAQTLVEWRLQVEQHAERAAPQRLSVLDETLIRAKYFGRRIGTERDLTRARQQQARQVNDIRERYAARRKAFGGRKQDIHATHAGSVDALHQRIIRKEQRLQLERQQVQKEAAASHDRVRQQRVDVEHEQDRLVAELWQHERTLAQLEHLSFNRYVRRILSL